MENAIIHLQKSHSEENGIILMELDTLLLGARNADLTRSATPFTRLQEPSF
jgi:hypothetical protein